MPKSFALCALVGFRRLKLGGQPAQELIIIWSKQKMAVAYLQTATLQEIKIGTPEDILPGNLRARQQLLATARQLEVPPEITELVQNILNQEKALKFLLSQVCGKSWSS